MGIIGRFLGLSHTPGQTLVNPRDELTYVWIPPGSFGMGLGGGLEYTGFDNSPCHPVKITRGFWLGQTPVTQEAYARVMGKNPSHFSGHTRPVEQVSWHDAMEYCSAIGMRLPTEAEWEYAAAAAESWYGYPVGKRQDPTSRSHLWDSTEDYWKKDREELRGLLDSIAWYHGNSGRQTHPVGQKQPNKWNLYDMLGNVREWTADWYNSRYYRLHASWHVGGSSRNAGYHWETNIRNPHGPESGEEKVVRGGSYQDGGGFVYIHRRDQMRPDVRCPYVGFRCAGVL
jgi:formylglycine-generating enzyme